MPCPYSGSFFFFTHICSTVSTHFPHLPNTMINYASTPRLSYTRAPFNSTQLLKASSLSSPTVSPLHPCWCPGLKNNWLRDRYLALSACLPKSEEIHNVNGSHLLQHSWNPPLTGTPDPLNLLHFPCTAKVAILDVRRATWVTEYCIFSWPLTLFSPSSLPLFLPSFTASTWKDSVVCNDVLPTSCFSSFSASSSHSPAPFPQSFAFLLITNKDTAAVAVSPVCPPSHSFPLLPTPFHFLPLPLTSSRSLLLPPAPSRSLPLSLTLIIDICDVSCPLALFIPCSISCFFFLII